MIRPALIASRRIAMLWLHYVDLHFNRALNHRVKVFHFEPQECAVSVGPVCRIAYLSVVMLNLKTVKL